MRKKGAGPVSLEKLEYIRENHQRETMHAMAKHLKVSYSFVARFCIQNNLKPFRPPAKKHEPKRPTYMRLPKRFLKMIQGHSANNTDQPQAVGEDAACSIQRPPAIYTNSPSPFGISDELHGNSIYHR